MFLDEAVAKIRSQAQRHAVPDEPRNLWDTVVAQIAARGCFDGEYADLLSELISEFLDSMDDGAVIDLWGQTETGANDNPEELVAEFIRFAISDELLDEVTKVACGEAKGCHGGKGEKQAEATEGLPESPHEEYCDTMKRQPPTTPKEWLQEIRAAIADAGETKPFGTLTRHPITDSDLFHLAPLVCLKFRGRKTKGPEAKRVIETALANYVVNSDPDGIDHGLKSKPRLAFALCYVAAHLALDLLNEQEAEAVLHYCEEHLTED